MDANTTETTGSDINAEAIAQRYSPASSGAGGEAKNRPTDATRKAIEEIEATGQMAADFTFAELLSAFMAARVTALGSARIDPVEIAQVRQLSAMADRVAALKKAEGYANLERR